MSIKQWLRISVPITKKPGSPKLSTTTMQIRKQILEFKKGMEEHKLLNNSVKKKRYEITQNQSDT